jgi:hypothetical protein
MSTTLLSCRLVLCLCLCLCYAYFSLALSCLFEFVINPCFGVLLSFFLGPCLVLPFLGLPFVLMFCLLLALSCCLSVFSLFACVIAYFIDELDLDCRKVGWGDRQQSHRLRKMNPGATRALHNVKG